MQGTPFLARLARAIALFLFVLACASGATYYIAANGSDSNSGSTKTTAWLHAPGMNGCSSNCASHAPVAGDQFIFRGGDTWHRSTGNPRGLDWTWTWSGTSANPIYLGVDKTWFTGGAWSRPLLNIDNPLSTSVVSSCTYDDTNAAIVSFINADYVTFDNFEMKGFCWSGGSGNHIDRIDSTYIVLSNLYIHGWTHTSGFEDTAWMIHGNSGGATHNSILTSTIDGSDSPYRSGFAVYGDCYELGGNKFRYLSNGAVCWNPTLIHDNLFEYIIESTDSAGTHGNALEEVGGHDGDGWFYNNVIRHTTGGGVGLGVTIWLNVASREYIFNNVFYDIGNAGNCLMLSNQQGNSSRNSTYIWNNTIDSPCAISFMSGDSTSNTFSGDVYFESNHFIGETRLADLIAARGGTYTTHETTDLYQSEASANAQGYTSADNYAPGGLTGATVGAGTNMTSSCGSAGVALCSDTSLGATRTPVARPTSGVWDIGAYQYSSGAPLPTAPGSLTAVVH